MKKKGNQKPTLYDKIITDELKTLRKKLKYKIVEVAKIINVSPSAITQYEKRTNKIQTFMLYKILKFYEVSMSDFFKVVDKRYENEILNRENI